MIKVSKVSVRKLIHLKRLPKKFRMFVPGCWLYDILKANKLDVPLWQQTYWVACRSLDAKTLGINWRAEQ